MGSYSCHDLAPWVQTVPAGDWRLRCCARGRAAPNEAIGRRRQAAGSVAPSAAWRPGRPRLPHGSGSGIYFNADRGGYGGAGGGGGTGGSRGGRRVVGQCGTGFEDDAGLREARPKRAAKDPVSVGEVDGVVCGIKGAGRVGGVEKADLDGGGDAGASGESESEADHQEAGPVLSRFIKRQCNPGAALCATGPDDATTRNRSARQLGVALLGGLVTVLTLVACEEQPAVPKAGVRVDPPSEGAEVVVAFLQGVAVRLVTGRWVGDGVVGAGEEQ